MTTHTTLAGAPKLPPKTLCVPCKGRYWCGPHCFVLERFEQRKQMLSPVNTTGELLGYSPPGVFIGHRNYPSVNVGVLAAHKNAPTAQLDNPKAWFGQSYEHVVNYRSQLLNAHTKQKVNAPQNPSRGLLELQELTGSAKAIEVEIKMAGPVSNQLNFAEGEAPMGPSAKLASVTLQETPRIPKAVEKVYHDTDLKSREGMHYLYDKNISPYTVTKIFSIGMTGEKRKRKLVPTRWAITAMDGALSDYLLDDIRDFPTLDKIEAYESAYVGNHFVVAFFPEKWRYENTETWSPSSSWNLFNDEVAIEADHESFEGRTKYVEETAGAYFAARLSITEHLFERKRQASAMVIRQIQPEYRASLGVWVIRETVKHALAQPPKTFETKESFLAFAKTKLQNNFTAWAKKSWMYDQLMRQKTLKSF